MAITPAVIRELRELTSAGMSDCKKALEESNGDLSKAVDYLREKGLAAAAKKAGRIAAEGVCHTVFTPDGSKGVVVEVNCETDFAAKGDLFRNYVVQVADQALASNAATLEAFLEEKWNDDPALTVKEALSVKIASVGENINIRRFERFEKSAEGTLCTYIHGGGKIAVLAEVACAAANDTLLEVGKNVCMQVAAMSPKFVKRSDVPAEFIEKETAILTTAAENENSEADKPKPKNVLDKIIEGRLNKYLKEVCLYDQAYFKDNDINVGQYLESVSKELGQTVEVSRFVRFEKGEGIEKKEENFAEEVSKAMGH